MRGNAVPPAIQGFPTGPSGPSFTGAAASGRISSPKIARPKTELHKLGGVVELTSIINLIDLEAQHREAMGLESGPRLFDGGAALQTPPGGPGPIPRPGHSGPGYPGAGHPGPRRPNTPAGAIPARETDPRDLLPTMPRPLPVAPSAAPSRVPQNQAERRGSPSKKKAFLQPWMVIIAIVIAAAVAGVIVAMSGPDVTAVHGK